MKDRDVFYLQYFVAIWLSLYFDHERRYRHHCAVCEHIYLLRPTVKVPFLIHSTPFPKKCLIAKLASCRYAGFMSWTLLKSPMGFVLKLVVEIASWLRKAK